MDTARGHELRWKALGLLAMAQFVVVLDASIVNVALPSIGSDLGFSKEDLSWVITAYTLPLAGFLLLGGRLADLLGRRRVFMSGLVLFAGASLLGGFASTEAQLIAARALQGLGAAILSPSALSIVTVLFADGAERNRALGIWGAVAGSGGAAGVLLGGILTEIGWQWVFFVNVPIGVGAAIIAPRLLAESRSGEDGRHFDFAGAISITAALSILVYALVEAPKHGWGSQQTISLLLASLLLHVVFIFIETRVERPMVPFRIFANRTRTGANVVGLLVGASLFSMFFFISLYMQNVLGYTPLRTGLAYLPLTASIIVSAGVASQLVTRIGYKPVMAFGLLMIACGLAWFSQVSSPGTYLGDVLPASVFAAIGLGFSFVPVTIAAVADTSDADAGLASGTINTSQQIGGAIGLALLVTIANSKIDSLLAAGGQPSLDALATGYGTAFLVGSGIAFIGLLATLTLVSGKASRAHTLAAGDDPSTATAEA